MGLSRGFSQRLARTTTTLLRLSLKNHHNRIVTCGLLVGLIYLPSWLWILWDITTRAGSSNLFLNAAFIYLGLHQLWKRRRRLAQITAEEEERLTGHVLILGGILIFALCFASISLKALSFALILVGIAYSTWGFNFFRNNAMPALWLLLSVYPDLGFLAITLWRNLTPPYVLEGWMAHLGGWGLNLIGQPAVANGPILSILPITPARSVEVASGCNGFDMAFSLAGFTLVMGLFLKLRRFTILGLMMASVALALSFNIPRIMLLTLASVYWGKSSFEFWHGPIGGQIFSMILFTAYYYVILRFVDSGKPASGKRT